MDSEIGYGEVERRYSDRGMYRHIRILLTLTVASITILVATIAWMLLYPYEPLEISTCNPLPLFTDDVVEQGGWVGFQFEVDTTHLDVEPEVHREFVDGIIFHVERSERSTIVTSDGKTARTRIRVPETLPPGEYFLRETINIRVNPIRVWSTVLYTEHFTVVAKE